jgi:hypothetical protein
MNAKCVYVCGCGAGERVAAQGKLFFANEANLSSNINGNSQKTNPNEAETNPNWSRFAVGPTIWFAEFWAVAGRRLS